MTGSEDEARPPTLERVALQAALDAMGSPAAIVGFDQGVLYANAAAARLASRGGIRPDALRAVLEGDEGDAWVTTLAIPGHVLAIFPDEGSEDVAGEWGLTGRQAETLALLVLGLPNKAIAERLGVALRTVEAHVTAILRKSGSSTRSHLLASARSRRRPRREGRGGR